MKIWLSLILVFFTVPFQINAEEKNKFKFGLLIPMSGEYQRIGDLCQQGFEVARSTISEKQGSLYEFIYGDAKTGGKEAVLEFTKMATQDEVHAVALIRSPVGMAVNAVSKQNKIPVLGGVAHPDFVPNNKYAYRFWASTEDDARALTGMLKKNSSSGAALLSSEDDWMEALIDDVKKELSRQSIPLLFNQELQPGSSDFRTLISRIRVEKPSEIFLALGPNSLGTAIRQIREQNLDQEIYSVFWAQSSDVLNSAGEEAMKGVKILELNYEKPKFLTAFKALYPEEKPTSATYSCYTQVMALIGASKQVQNPSSEAIYTALQNLQSFKTLDDTIQLSNRNVHYDIAIKEFVDQKWVQRG